MKFCRLQLFGLIPDVHFSQERTSPAAATRGSGRGTAESSGASWPTQVRRVSRKWNCSLSLRESRVTFWDWIILIIYLMPKMGNETLGMRKYEIFACKNHATKERIGIRSVKQQVTIDRWQATGDKRQATVETQKQNHFEFHFFFTQLQKCCSKKAAPRNYQKMELFVNFTDFK